MINLITKAYSKKTKKRNGFTLVEVIVVLVILAILAAIAIPALTGYIDKANDKKEIAEARNYSVAVRTILSEAYGTGELSHAELRSDMDDYINNGSREFASGTKSYYLYYFGMYMYGVYGVPGPGSGTAEDFEDYYNRVSDLIGAKHRIGPDGSAFEPGYWDFWLAGSNDSTAYTADGFLYYYVPEGYKAGESAIVVTYKLETPALGSNPTFSEFETSLSQFSYDANAGYTVYKCLLD
jgi:prepilin-type N-terminal cleavage/methylation domain-containing protein